MLFKKVVLSALIFATICCKSQFVIAEEKTSSPFEFNGYMDITIKIAHKPTLLSRLQWDRPI
ncbi:MAG: hypothetical protein IPJ71_17330 [Bdellovibrionales bacterium]|nr:hypothetical protein [Bdellovibrionales bacterium]